MITLLDGSKLPCHDEFYKLFDKLKIDIFKRLYFSDAEELYLRSLLKDMRITIDALPDLRRMVKLTPFFDNVVKWESNNITHCFEDGDWDIVIARSNCADFIYNIEYKSNINEWKKGINDFLNQIQKREEVNWNTHRNYSYIEYTYVKKVLLTFDSRFLEYEKVMASNNIRLLVLPQSLLIKEKVGFGARKKSGVGDEG